MTGNCHAGICGSRGVRFPPATRQSLAWTIYTDLKTKTQRPAPQVIARRVRIELADRAPIEPTERDRIIDAVVAETIQAIDD